MGGHAPAQYKTVRKQEERESKVGQARAEQKEASRTIGRGKSPIIKVNKQHDPGRHRTKKVRIAPGPSVEISEAPENKITPEGGRAEVDVEGRWVPAPWYVGVRIGEAGHPGPGNGRGTEDWPYLMCAITLAIAAERS